MKWKSTYYYPPNLLTTTYLRNKPTSLTFRTMCYIQLKVYFLQNQNLVYSVVEVFTNHHCGNFTADMTQCHSSRSTAWLKICSQMNVSKVVKDYYIEVWGHLRWEAVTMAMRGDEVMERSPALARSTETCKDSDILQQFHCDCSPCLLPDKRLD